MQGQRGFWDVEDRLKELPAEGDPLEKLRATVDFEMFRPVLVKAPRRRAPSKGGRPPFDPVLKFKMLVLQALLGLSLAQTSYMVHDRLSWMRFCGLDGARPREGLVDPANAASDAWADTASRSAANEAFLEKAGKTSRIHHKKPKGKPMPKPLARGNAARSKVRARVEHVFAEQKDRSRAGNRTSGIQS